MCNVSVMQSIEFLCSTFDSANMRFLPLATFNIGTSIYGHTLKDDDFNKLKNKINEQHEEYSRLSKIYNNKKRVTGNYKKAMLDSLMISSAAGVEYYNYGVIPNDITKAYELAYPDLSQQYSLQDIIDNSSPAEARGYINGIKGKLFELEYVDYLNSGILPDGYEAALAESATKPGWDIQVTDAYGNIADVWQLKAANDAEYVKAAL